MPTIPLNDRMEIDDKPPHRQYSKQMSIKMCFFIGLVPFLLVASMFFILDNNPPMSPVDYCRNKTAMNCPQKIAVLAGHLTSDKWFSRDLDYLDLGMCLGHGLRKRNYHLLNYAIDFGRNEDCKQLCTRSYELVRTDWLKNTDELSNCRGDDAVLLYTLTNAIKDNYRQQLNIDEMSVIWCSKFDLRPNETIACRKFFPIGCYVDKDGHRGGACVLDPQTSKRDTYYLFNHLEFVITYNEYESKKNLDGSSDGRITSIKVTPKSIDHNVYGGCGHQPMAINGSLSSYRSLNITYSYSVTFVKDNSNSWHWSWEKVRRRAGKDTEYEKYWQSSIMFVSLVVSVIVALMSCCCAWMVLDIQDQINRIY